MRKLACLFVMVAGTFALGGCFASPAYTGAENTSRTLRTWDYETKQGVEDAMQHIFMVTPPSRMSQWHLR